MLHLNDRPTLVVFIESSPLVITSWLKNEGLARLVGPDVTADSKVKGMEDLRTGLEKLGGSFRSYSATSNRYDKLPPSYRGSGAIDQIIAQKMPEVCLNILNFLLNSNLESENPYAFDMDLGSCLHFFSNLAGTRISDTQREQIQQQINPALLDKLVDKLVHRLLEIENRYRSDFF